jgi:hypothetical protein
MSVRCVDISYTPRGDDFFHLVCVVGNKSLRESLFFVVRRELLKAIGSERERKATRG